MRNDQAIAIGVLILVVLIVGALVFFGYDRWEPLP